ncbi:hypothetical protein K501DRAFT_271011 [Backusella circina FSU 941]|nr:hypothetical protein K501DRAFT_271011 [Backusella circina FSU 941]
MSHNRLNYQGEFYSVAWKYPLFTLHYYFIDYISNVLSYGKMLNIELITFYINFLNNMMIMVRFKLCSALDHPCRRPILEIIIFQTRPGIELSLTNDFSRTHEIGCLISCKFKLIMVAISQIEQYRSNLSLYISALKLYESGYNRNMYFSKSCPRIR